MESSSVETSSVISMMIANCKSAVRLNLADMCRVIKSAEASGVYVRRGTVWLTGTPAAADVILRAGDQFRFGRRWPYVIQALGEEAEICLVN